MMLKAIIIFVLYFFEQKFAFALPINADNAIETLVEGEYSADANNNIFGRNPAPYVPELPFIVTPNENNALYPIQFPQYNNQFDTNGLQSEFSAGLTVPFSSGQLINPSGFYDIRGVEENFATSDPSGPHFKSEVFDLTSEGGQNHYENGQLVEQIPNPSQMTEQGGNPITMNNNPPSQQPPIQQQPQPSIQQQTPVQQPAPMKQQPSLPQQPLVQQQQPLVKQQQQQQQPLVQQQPTTQQPQSSNINTQQMQQGGPPQGIVKMSSTAAASSTFRKQENGQPPEVVQTAGISHLNYDSTRPNPVNGGYVAAGEYIPNANDPNQSYYSVSQGLYPNQLQTHSQPQYSQPQPQNPQLYSQPQNTQLYSQPQAYSQPQSYSQPQAYSQPQQYSQQNPSNFNIQPNRLYLQQANPQLMNSQQTESRQNQQIPFNYQNYRLDQQIPTQAILSAASKQINNLGQLPNHAMGAINNFFQIFPKLAQDVVNDGLQLVRIPFDMGDAALEKFITDLDNVHFNRFAQAPAQGGRTVLRTIQNVFDQMQTNMQPQQAVAGLVRRAPQPWMIPDVDLSSSYDSAQRKFNEIKSDISTRFPPLSFSRISSFIPSPQLPSFSQNPIVSQPAINGEPIVKAFSSSISESTQSSSINGAPPEVAHQAQGFTSEYDSTKTDEPFKADAVALESYIPNINDPTKGIFRGYEDSYPSKRIDA